MNTERNGYKIIMLFVNREDEIMFLNNNVQFELLCYKSGVI